MKNHLADAIIATAKAKAGRRANGTGHKPSRRGSGEPAVKSLRLVLRVAILMSFIGCRAICVAISALSSVTNEQLFC